MLRRLVLLTLLFLAAPALAQEEAPAASPVFETVRVVLTTQAGPIVIDVETERAPVTAANFLRYVDARRLDGTEFYRAMKTAPEAGLIQGGVRDPRNLFPPIAHEPTSETGLSHVDGALSVPRFAPGTAQGDFTIMVGDQLYLDAQPGSAGDGLGYAVFGRVVEGMELVDAIKTGAPFSGMVRDPDTMISAKIEYRN